MSAEDRIFANDKFRTLGSITIEGTITTEELHGVQYFNGGCLRSLLTSAVPKDFNGQAHIHIEVAVEDQPSAT